MKWKAINLTWALTAIVAIPQAHSGPIENLKPGQWLAVRGSEMRSVVLNPIPSDTFAVEGPGAVIHSWSGAAFDTLRDKLIVWGGGHAAYAGNEIYGFSVDRLSWERITDPSPLDGWKNGDTVMPDRRPLSVHTYDGLEYIPPPIDRLFAADGSRYPDGYSTGQVWHFDFSTNTWTRKRDLPGDAYHDVRGFSHVSDFDPQTRHIFMYGSYYLVEYDPANDTWQYRSNMIERPMNMTAALDTKRRKFVVLGSGYSFVFDLAKPGTTTRQTLDASGGREITDCTGPGVVYDPVTDRIVAWCRNADVYSLNLDSLVWTRHQSKGGDHPGDPYHPNYHGTYGRFRYVPSKNAFIVVTHIDKPVYFYRLDAGSASEAR